jgi:hypothetical protein
MPITTLASREFNQDTSRAKKAARSSPVVNTDRANLTCSWPSSLWAADRWSSEHRGDPVHAGLSGIALNVPGSCGRASGSDIRCYADEEAVGFLLDNEARVKLERVQERRFDRQLVLGADTSHNSFLFCAVTRIDPSSRTAGLSKVGEWENLGLPSGPSTIDRLSQRHNVVEWRIKLETTSGWGEVEAIEVAHFTWLVVGLTAEEVGLEEAKRISADL